MNATALLVFARCVGFFMRAPGFSHPAVPATVRAGLALALTMVLVPVVRAANVARGIDLTVALACDLGIGAAIGSAASLLYDGAYAGGRALDDYVGIRGSVPSAQTFAPSGFGRIWSLIFTAGFFVSGGYRIAIDAFSRSFAMLPPGGIPRSSTLYDFAVGYPSAIVQAALLVAGPAIALVFVAQLTLGSLTRVIPRFAAFTLSFPIVFGVALIATLACVPMLTGAAATPWLRIPFLSAR